MVARKTLFSAVAFAVSIGVPAAASTVVDA